MHKKFIKNFLFSIAGFSVLPNFAAAYEKEDLTLIENLPIEQRVVVHDHVIRFLEKNPEFAREAKIIAVDKEGNVYVLDEKKVILFNVGNPSCGSAE
ncbi:MAG: hypothetical protein SGJ18_06450 [Pseudomonadota bacterium]|nr:hypothetical protein [Pseudomonadota bacterium]